MATVPDIERHAAAERRDREGSERAAARDAAHEREDREFQRARARAIFRAKPDRREDVEMAWDIAEAERERLRAASDFDAGRGSGRCITPDSPPKPIVRRTDAVDAVLGER